MIGRIVLSAGIAGVVVLGACNKKPSETPPQQTPALTQGAAGSSVAGISWTVPGRWSVGAQRQMRVATYTVTSPDKSAGDAECAVFYFGQNEGGDVESNMNRWVGQFEDAGSPDRSTREVDGMNVHIIKVAGTYVGMSGPMMNGSQKMTGYRLLGAIVEAPQGSVFFKMTGPEATVMSAESEFNTMIGSVTK